MDIIKHTLEKQLNELRQEISQLEKQHDEILTKSTHDLVDKLDESFKEFDINVTTTNITFNLGGGWDKFRITRRENYSAKDNEYKYLKPELHMSSMSTDCESDLKILICVGKLAEQKLNHTDIWKDLTTMMDSRKVLYKDDISEKYDQTWKLENEIRLLERREQDNTFQKIFNQGTFKLNKNTNYYYGNGKWDSVYSDEFVWEQNGEGKTYTVYYYDSYRTNPYYDENGNVLEPIIERRKRSINKRIRKNDIESFIRSCMSIILKD